MAARSSNQCVDLWVFPRFNRHVFSSSGAWLLPFCPMRCSGVVPPPVRHAPCVHMVPQMQRSCSARLRAVKKDSGKQPSSQQASKSRKRQRRLNIAASRNHQAQELAARRKQPETANNQLQTVNIDSLQHGQQATLSTAATAVSMLFSILFGFGCSKALP